MKGLEFQVAKGQNVRYALNGNKLIIELTLDAERYVSNGPAKSQMVGQCNIVYDSPDGKKCVVNMNSYEKNTKSNIAALNEEQAKRIAELEAKLAGK